MRIKDKYVNVLEQNGGSLGVRRSDERISSRWWFVSEPRDNVTALVHAAVDAALDQAQAAHDEYEKRVYEKTTELERKIDQLHISLGDAVKARDAAAAFRESREREIDHLGGHARAQRSRAERAEAQVEKLKAEVARLESVAKARDSAIQNLTVERDQARADNAKVMGLLVEAGTKGIEQGCVMLDLRARLNGAKADKEVLQRKLAIAYEEKAQAEAKLRAAARGGGHAMGQDSSEERARDLDPVRREGLRPGEGSWSRMARIFVEDSQAAAVANAILEEQAETSVKVNEIVHRHGLDTLDHALRDARYKHGHSDVGNRQRVARVTSVGALCGRVVELSLAYEPGQTLPIGAFVDLYPVHEHPRLNKGPVRVQNITKYRNEHFATLTLSDAAEYVSLKSGTTLYLSP